MRPYSPPPSSDPTHRSFFMSTSPCPTIANDVSTPLSTINIEEIELPEDRLGQRDYEENAITKALHNENVNLHTRLLSIEHDTYRMLCHYESITNNDSNRLPLFGNARAGLWYLPPFCESSSSPLSSPSLFYNVCSFKSADGHYGKWNSSPRRPNLHLLESLTIHKGAIIIDVTRSGKKIPDSLSKTIPIWCAIITSLLKDNHSHDYLHLHQSISESEHHSIVKLLPQWINAWRNARMHLHPIITKAKEKGISYVRTLWTMPSRPVWQNGIPLSDLDFIPVVCISASDAILHGERMYIEPENEVRHALGTTFPKRKGFAYVQGAGDDEETWARSLTPKCFWMNRHEILADDNNELAVVTRRVDKIVEGYMHSDIQPQRAQNNNNNINNIDHNNNNNNNIIEDVWHSFISVFSLHHQQQHVSYDKMLNMLYQFHKDDDDFGLIIILDGSSESESITVNNNNIDENPKSKTKPKILHVSLTNHKGKTDFKYAFGRALGPCLSSLRQCIVRDRRKALISCTSKHGDWTAGLVIAWLAWYCTLREETSTSPEYHVSFSNEQKQEQEQPVLDKDEIHHTMMHFLASFPQFQLTRATLKQLNRFFSSPSPSSVVTSSPSA